MGAVLYVFLGGGVGAVLRYALTEFASKIGAFWSVWAVASVNILGCFLMGMVMGWVLVDPPAREPARQFLVIGLLGGFTTFSAFAWDAFILSQETSTSYFLIYVLASVLLSLIAVFIGFILTH